MNRTDLDRAIDWAAKEGWNPGTYDAAAFFAADPDGFFLGAVGGEPVACVAGVRYADHFGFLGLYIVRPEYRGRGFGRTVWAAATAHLAGRNIGLEGVLDQVPNYERCGFRAAHHTIRYIGTGGGNRPAGLTPLGDIPFAAIAGYDSACFPARRDAFLRAWVALPESFALGATDSRGLTGYGVLRKSVTGHKIGPLFADDAETAARLYAGLAAAVPGGALTIDVPDDSVQPFGRALAVRFGLTEVFRTVRMYTDGVPAIEAPRVFGVTSLELG